MKGKKKHSIPIDKNRLCVLVFVTVVVLLFPTLRVAAQSPSTGDALWFSNGRPHPQNTTFRPAYIYCSLSGTTGNLVKKHLTDGLSQIVGTHLISTSSPHKNGLWIALGSSKAVQKKVSPEELEALEQEGFMIRYLPDEQCTLLTGNSEKALLYAVFHLLRILQTQPLNLQNLRITEVPVYQKRILNHWDNLDGTVERGYAGRSIWQWDQLPEVISPRYAAYAAANASIGINGTVLNNVNAAPEILSTPYLEKVKAIAGQLRPYGIQVYLSVNFAAPKALGGLPTAHPKDARVIAWWQQKVAEIYRLIPDFGGFLVKANSEGQPGPMDYGCTHAEGANLLADALAPYHGMVMWRAFVYSANGNDRAKQAYEEFLPMDGRFRKNVLLQVKNGPVDFQPREPFSPLFGAMQHTGLMPEVQITQEYLGFSDHLVFLGTLFSEFLQSDTYIQGRGSTVARVTSTRSQNIPLNGIAGVANIGLDTNWCGHPFAQSNWYAFGRLAWNPEQSPRAIAREWIQQSLTQQAPSVNAIEHMMMKSREATVNYMTPLGLHHLMGWDHHYGPEPWCEVPGARPDWLPSYYHKADSAGIGFNRSSTGTNATSQYAQPLSEWFDNPATCPKEFLLWFHHLPWSHELSNGNTLWQELCYRYQSGVDDVRFFQQAWQQQQSVLNPAVFTKVQQKLEIHLKEAIWWRDACLLYFQTFSRMPFPATMDAPVHKLEELKQQKFDLKHHNE